MSKGTQPIFEEPSFLGEEKKHYLWHENIVGRGAKEWYSCQGQRSLLVRKVGSWVCTEGRNFLTWRQAALRYSFASQRGKPTPQGAEESSPAWWHPHQPHPHLQQQGQKPGELYPPEASLSPCNQPSRPGHGRRAAHCILIR